MDDASTKTVITLWTAVQLESNCGGQGRGNLVRGGASLNFDYSTMRSTNIELSNFCNSELFQKARSSS